jgi:hypothetical protein
MAASNSTGSKCLSDRIKSGDMLQVVGTKRGALAFITKLESWTRYFNGTLLKVCAWQEDKKRWTLTVIDQEDRNSVLETCEMTPAAIDAFCTMQEA